MHRCGFAASLRLIVQSTLANDTGVASVPEPAGRPYLYGAAGGVARRHRSRTLPADVGAQEGWVRQDDTANGFGHLARYHGRRHASHRVAQQNRSGKPEPLDESHNIACMILVPIPMGRCARIPMPSGVWHDYIVFTFQSACQRNPAGSAPGQSMEQNHRGLASAGSQIVDADTVCFADSVQPVGHWR